MTTSSRDHGQPHAVALVHDWLNQEGGAEYVLGVLHEMFPTAPIHTSIADVGRVPAAAAWDVRVSWMDRLPAIHANHQPYLPLYPLAWNQTHVRGSDVVVSNKSGFCHGVRTNGSPHVCYCLTPTRYVWQPEAYLAYERVPAAGRLALRAALPALRRWDRGAADRVDRFVAISTEVRDRIARYYGRDSDVVHPPLDLGDYERSAEIGEAYLVLARLVPYKRIDLAVQAFTRLGMRLDVVGGGRDMDRLQAMAGPTVRFTGRVPRSDVIRRLARCRGLVWPGVEDYGLAPVEAMASGRPVVARRAGGVLDTVVDGVTGVFFDTPDADALAAAVQRAERTTWRPAGIRAHAERFGRDVFERGLAAHVDAAVETARARGWRGTARSSGAAPRAAEGGDNGRA
jgi:glycosyltransferase involved in cell wall biosynthesis